MSENVVSRVLVEISEGRTLLRPQGNWTVAGIRNLNDRSLRFPSDPKDIEIDLGNLGRIDTAGATLIAGMIRRLEVDGRPVRIVHADPHAQSLLDLVRAHWPEPDVVEERESLFLRMAEATGRFVVNTYALTVRLLGFFGMVLVRIFEAVVRPHRLRVTSLVHHLDEVGLRAVPIVALMAFLIGVVMAYQGATQLRQFGAEIFVVNLIAVSVLRELGVLLTAIIVAGRSGSAFTAAIGSMKVREEIDAMRALGLDPAEVLIIPRILALLVMLPLLGFIANIAGLVGGALMSWLELGISPTMFILRLSETTDIWHFGVGMIKAPVFALIIGVIGCFEGFEVSGSAESVGRLTTTSVVLSIFTVIVADAAFSVLFARIGI